MTDAVSSATVAVYRISQAPAAADQIADYVAIPPTRHDAAASQDAVVARSLMNCART